MHFELIEVLKQSSKAIPGEHIIVVGMWQEHGLLWLELA